MKHKLMAVFILIIYVVGACFVLYPQVTDFLMKQKQSKAAESFEHGQEPDDLYERMAEYNQSLIENGQAGLSDAWTDEEMSGILETSGFTDDMVGILSIDAMDVTIPLYFGADEESLYKGAAILADTSFPIGGESTNCVIAAHRGGYEGTAMFRDIEVLQAGDVITITNPWEVLEYEVVGHIVIEPNQLSAIKIIPGADMVTLVTCHPYGDNTQRYVVYCQRRGSDDPVSLPEGEMYVSSEDMIAKEGFVTMIGNGGIAILGIAVVILVVKLIRS